MGVGALNSPPQERRRLAALYATPIISAQRLFLTASNRSREWTCPQCKQRNIDLLPDPIETTKSTADTGRGSAHEPTEAARPTAALPASNETTPSLVALPTFQSTAIQSVKEASTTEPPLALTAPQRNISFVGMGPKPGPRSEPADAKPASSTQRPNRPVQREIGVKEPHDRQVEYQPQLRVEAFPAFRGSDVAGVPRWLDSAILILSVLLGGIMIHRVMF